MTQELVVTETGCEVITKFPAEDLLVAGKRYYTTGGYLPIERDSQSHINTQRVAPERASSDPMRKSTGSKRSSLLRLVR